MRRSAVGRDLSCQFDERFEINQKGSNLLAISDHHINDSPCSQSWGSARLHGGLCGEASAAQLARAWCLFFFWAFRALPAAMTMSLCPCATDYRDSPCQTVPHGCQRRRPFYCWPLSCACAVRDGCTPSSDCVPVDPRTSLGGLLPAKFGAEFILSRG